MFAVFPQTNEPSLKELSKASVRRQTCTSARLNILQETVIKESLPEDMYHRPAEEHHARFPPHRTFKQHTHTHTHTHTHGINHWLKITVC